MKRIAVIDLVALTGRLLGENTPRIVEFSKTGSIASINPAFPAVTCSAQANYLTGVRPQIHGIVGNGWYDRELAEHLFWKQSNRLVRSKKIYDELRELVPGFTCAKLFWWFNMYSGADYSITPRPVYFANGRKIPDIYSHPYLIRDEITRENGKFPFATFWGPFAGRKSELGDSDSASRWIANAAKWIEERYKPTLNLVYLPHLDYNLQRFGPDPHLIKEDLRKIDDIAGDLISFFRSRDVGVIILSEYSIHSVSEPIFLNRLFREKGWIAIKDEYGMEKLDMGASKVFAISDHQVAHIYVNDKTIIDEVKNLLWNHPHIQEVLDEKRKTAIGISHERAGDLIAVAKNNAWFSYYYWFDDKCAPDFARTVDIHRKPGYDPVELFLDEQNPLIKQKLMLRLLQSKLGFRVLMDVIPLDATLVKGSHGGFVQDTTDYPLIITDIRGLLDKKIIDSTEVYQIIKSAVVNC